MVLIQGVEEWPGDGEHVLIAVHHRDAAQQHVEPGSFETAALGQTRRPYRRRFYRSEWPGQLGSLRGERVRGLRRPGLVRADGLGSDSLVGLAHVMGSYWCTG